MAFGKQENLFEYLKISKLVVEKNKLIIIWRNLLDGKKTYLIKYNGEIYTLGYKVNPRGYTYDEANQCIKSMKWENAILISIEDEKYKLQGDPLHQKLFTPESYVYDTWFSAYIDNSINGIKLPIELKIYVDCRNQIGA